MIKTVTDYLEASAQRVSDKLAFQDEARSLTFAQTAQEAKSVASALLALLDNKPCARKPVAVYLEKSVECICAFMGVAYSGNYYTPLDTEMPQARIEKIIETLEPPVIITDQAHAEEAQGFGGSAQILLYEDAAQCAHNTELLAACHEMVLETDVLYVLFTSGSTGMPKGVVVPHSAVISYSEWVGERFDIDETTIFGNQTPFYFVMSVLDIYQTLRAGASMHIIPKQHFSFPVILMNYLQEHHVNTLYWVPSALCAVANLGALEDIHLDDLRLVMFGGEVMPTKQLNMWIAEYPEACFVNQYGQTEAMDICAYYIVNRSFENGATLPIGHPAEFARVELLDGDVPVAAGATGEICVSGPGLAYGYFKDPEKTAQAFVLDPSNSCWQQRMYRTGDLAQYNEFGELEFVSRKDFQIKHMGNRIELGEIEAIASGIDDVERVCCLYDSARRKIVMFYTGTIAKDQLKAQLKNALPDYMVPNKVKQLEAMPFNVNGKIDRNGLKELL